MPDLKISQLTAITPPIAGTDVLPVVQSSTTKKITVAQLVPGLGSFTAPSGNVKGLVWSDGTTLANDTTVTDVGYDTSTHTLQAKNLNVSDTGTFTKDITTNNLTVGKGSGSITTNTALGYHTLLSNTTGYENTAMGYEAGTTLTTGTSNTLVGKRAGYVLTGNRNVAIGSGSLQTFTQGAAGPNSSATAVGYNALSANVNGDYNTAIGQYALQNATGGSLACVGSSAGATVTTANNITALGSYTISTGTGCTGSNNTAIGCLAGRSLTSGYDNTFIGSGFTGYTSYGAGQATSTGYGNTALGCMSLWLNSTGYKNTTIGYEAGESISTGNTNTFIGNQAGLYVSTGSKNTILGSFNGNQNGLDIRTLNNYLVMSDGDGNPRIYHNGTTVVIPNLPTSATGLPTGGLYVSAGVLMVA